MKKHLQPQRRLQLVFLSVGLFIMTLFIGSCIHFNSQSSLRRPSSVERTPEKALVLIGQIPGEYVGKSKNRFYLGVVEVANRVVQKVEEISPAQVSARAESERQAGKVVVVLKSAQRTNYDAIYPGLLNLHNHTKQNVLPTWTSAKGQFENRFEWRAWVNYKKSVSKNMNPWISYGAAMNCAAFRWSNLQNMINGATYLQGPSQCFNGFGIYKVEDSSAYISEKSAVQAPTDLVFPKEMVYVWDVLRPGIESGQTYEQALLHDIQRHCGGLGIAKVTLENIDTSEGLKILSNKKLLEAACTKEKESLHPKFIRYVYYIHKTIAGKKEYLKSPNHSAVIAHLAEGRRTDPYNQIEYRLIKLLGLNQANVNFIHGVGLKGNGVVAHNPSDKYDDFLDMAHHGMGLIWSPYSNLLLYGETLDIEAAHTAGVRIALGSDWVPTGTKSVLEEIKVAAHYVDRMKTRDGKKQLNTIFNDEYLYRMVTENSARLINHWEIKPGEAGVGQIKVGAMGSLIAVKVQDANPFTNLVRKATERQINLVVLDGVPVYGNTDYLEQAGVSNYEVFSNEISDADKLTTNESIPKPDLTKISLQSSDEDDDDEQSDNAEASTQEQPFLNQLAQAARQAQLTRFDSCHFEIPKAFVTPNTKPFERVVDQFQHDTLMDLDKVSDLQILLAVSSMTQSLNRISPQGDKNFAMKYFPNLYTCSDPNDRSSHRFETYIKSDGNDELKENLGLRESLRKGVPQKAAELAQQYGL